MNLIDSDFSRLMENIKPKVKWKEKKETHPTTPSEHNKNQKCNIKFEEKWNCCIDYERKNSQSIIETY